MRGFSGRWDIVRLLFADEEAKWALKNKRSMVRRLGAALYNLRTLQVHCAGNGRWVSVRSRPLNDSLKPYLNSYTST